MRGRRPILGALVIAGLLAAPASAHAVAFITWASENETDYVGQGKTARATSDDPNNRVFTNSRAGYFDLTVGSYLAIFRAPLGQDLQLGTYTDNFGTGDRATGDASPSIDVSGEGRGCNSEQGVFTIRDLARDAAGTITRIHVIYDQRCTESTARLRGQVAYGYPEGTTPENIGSAVPGPAPAPADTTRPLLGPLGLSRSVFGPARSGPSASASAKVGTRVGFTLSEPGPVTVTVQRRSSGRKVGRRCAATTRSNRRRQRCTRWLSQKGTFRVAGRAGRNSFRFSGRLAGRALKRGSYRLGARARDASGNPSALRRKSFRIAR